MKNNFFEVRNFIFAMVAFGTTFTIISYLISYNLRSSVVIGTVGGLLFALLLNTVKQILQACMLKTGPQNYCYTEPANHVVGSEAVGGLIYFFNDRLEFHAHPLNINRETVLLPYTEIRKVECKGFPERVSLELNTGEYIVFIVNSGQDFALRLAELTEIDISL